MNDYSLHLNEQDWAHLFRYLRTNPRTLLHDKSIRAAIIKRRQEHYGVEKVFDGELPHSITLTIPYNLNHARNGLESNVVRLIRPLSVLDPVHDKAAELKVLSVGGRTEAELLTLVANGFSPENVTCIDVVSVSPLIQIMDAHHMSFPDNSFDVLTLGWTVPYSSDASLMLSECVRVLKSGGLLAVGWTRVPETHEEYPALVTQKSTIYMSSADLMRDLPGGIVYKSALVHEPLEQDVKGAVLVILRVLKP